MTGHQINSLVGDLVAMAQAMEELPKVKHELAIREDDYNQLLNRIKLVQDDLDQAKSYAASLEQKVRDAEVAKDQAETMFLEADERTSRALDFIKATFGNAGSLIQALEPVKVEPKIADVISGYPYGVTDSIGRQLVEPVVHEAHFEAGVQGQSEPDPTNGPETSQLPQTEGSGSGTQSSTDTISSTSRAGPASTDTSLPASTPAPAPYAGKKYIDCPNWIPLAAWLDGGGTEADYHFRY